jgi:hypothetical protein
VLQGHRAGGRAVLLAGFVICGLTVLRAQVSSGSVAGQVLDPSGAGVPNATVTLVNQGTGVERSVKSGEGGDYSFPALQAGFYTIRAEHPGFRGFEVKNLEVQVAQAVRQDVQLTIGETKTKMEVVASAPVLDERNAEVGQVIGTKETSELPLNGRNYFELAKLAPGVAELAGTSQSNGLAINGQRANQISFYFDGVDVRTETSGRPAFTPSIEAIQEFKIQTNSFSAEYGRNPAAINVSLKSGANAFHGALFEFLRNDALDARSFFSRTVDPLRRNQFGGVLSGPLVKNKTFFMVNYEGLRTRQSNTLYLSVPTEAQRQGNFAGGPTIYDPATLDPSTNRRQPFAGNIIPRERFGLIGVSALKYYPLPNTSGNPAYNYVTGVSSVNDGDQFHGRIDHQFNERDTLFGRVSWSTANTNSPAGLPYTGSLENITGVNLTVQESHMLGPNRINEFRAAWTFYNDLLGFPTLDHDVTRSEFGLQNLAPPSTAYGIPQLNVPGLSTLGSNMFQPQGPRENIYNVADDFSWILGRHSVKFGFDGRYYRPSQRVQQTPNGAFTFANQFSNQPGVSGTGSPVADLLLGFPSNVRATQFGQSNGWVSMKYYYYGFYFQDEFRVSPRLTLNLGLRYEYQTPYNERYGDLAIFDLNTTRFLLLGKDVSGLNPPDRNNFAPRIGVAYSLSPKTVIRMGSGVFYGEPRGNEFGSFQLSPPFVIDSTIVSSALVPDLVGRAFPPVNVRDASGNIIVTPNTNVFSMEPNFRTNYTYQWTFNIQREIRGGWLAEIGYIGNSAHKLTGRVLANQATPDIDPTHPTPIASRRPNPNVGDVSYVASIDNSNYHGLEAKLNKRFASGLSIIAAYTFSKAMGIGGNLFGDQSRQQDRRNRAQEYAPLDFNQTHRFTAAWIYELPFGKGKPIGNTLPGVPGALASGWSVQGIYTLHSGFPLSPASGTSVNVGRADANRPNRICDGNLPRAQRTISRWFDTSCFVDHPFGVFGNSGNNILIGPGMNTVNLTAMKNTRMALGSHEFGTLQFRAELFNAFNHANFGDPGLTVNTAQFGVIRSVRIPGRQIQLAMKILF